MPVLESDELISLNQLLSTDRLDQKIVFPLVDFLGILACSGQSKLGEERNEVSLRPIFRVMGDAMGEKSPMSE
jgi:hypothetical protein